MASSGSRRSGADLRIGAVAQFALGGAGQGKSVEDATHGKLAEGAFTARVMVEMARAHDVELPIAEAVDAILSSRLSVDGAIGASLLMRPLKAED